MEGIDGLYRRRFAFSSKRRKEEFDVKRRNSNGEAIRRQVRTALGQEKADLVVVDGSLVNVYTAEIQKHYSVGVKGNRIVYVGEGPNYLIGPETTVVNAQGMYITPGFLDPHTHLDGVFRCAEYARHAVPHGNTTAISESAMVANAAGSEGVAWFCEATRDLPLRILILAPSMIPPFPEFETSKGFSYDDFATLLGQDFVLGIGETYWPRVTNLDERAVTRYALAEQLDKTKEGHAAGARGERLMAYLAAGTSSCHESTNAEEVLEKLRLGMGVMIREGSIRTELDAIAPIKDLGLDLRKVMLCTDLADPQMLLNHGCMDEVVRRAIRKGFDPVVAIQMATLNPANHFGLRDLGGIAPGAIADILLVSDLGELVVKTVIKDGIIVAQDGRLRGECRRYDYPEAAYHTFLVERVRAEDFRLPFPRKRSRVRIVDIVNETITREIQTELVTRQGNIAADPEQDILKMAHIFKHSHHVQRALGFVHGLGLKEGAVATSLIWDTNNILVVGATDREMAFAVNRLLEHQGGFIVVKGEHVVAELPTPICGIISDMRLEEIAQKMSEIEGGCRQLGCSVARPFLTLQTLVFTGLPFLRLTDRGLVDVRKRAFVDLILS